jgi:hypothetical protein
LQVIAGQLQHRTLATQVSIPRWAARVGRLVPSTAVLLACLSEPAAELANRHTLTNDRSLAAGAAAAAARVCACVCVCVDDRLFKVHDGCRGRASLPAPSGGAAATPGELPRPRPNTNAAVAPG